jgi:hypothetical protein
MSEMGSYDPFGHMKHKLRSKEGPGVKLTVWLLTTKSLELTWSPYIQVACYILLESSWQGIQLLLRPHINRRSTEKVVSPQSCGSPKFGNFRTPIWEFRDKLFANNLKTSKKWKLQGSWNGTIVLINKKITKVVCFNYYNHKTMACNN